MTWLKLIRWLSLATLAGAVEPKPIFVAEGNEYRFDTGALRGILRAKGKSQGLLPVVDGVSGSVLARSLGLFSHYRLLDAKTRYGTAAWDWTSETRLLADDTVEARWAADAAHPFDMKATYHWAAPNTLDVTSSVTARQELQRFEVFLASYFEGFASAFVHTKNGWQEAKKENGVWQAFPRDDAAAKIIAD